MCPPTNNKYQDGLQYCQHSVIDAMKILMVNIAGYIKGMIKSHVKINTTNYNSRRNYHNSPDIIIIIHVLLYIHRVHKC